MFLRFQPFFIIAETPLHPGSGGELGIVDLPIQRERHTNFPKIEGSGLKGCIREAFENSTKEIEINSSKISVSDEGLISLVFGPEDGDQHAGAIAFTDAKILLFPVKSLIGVFAWITCEMVLNRFLEDMKIAGRHNEWEFTIVTNTIPKQSNILISNRVVLEEFTFDIKENEETKKIAEKLSENIFPQDNVYNFWKEKLKKDLVILPNDEFKDFVEISTEVITRTKISSDTGTVESRALWTEEYLPQDTILYSISMASPIRVRDDSKKGILEGDSPEKEAENVIKFFKKGLPEVIHIGGNQTIGKGIVRIKIL